MSELDDFFASLPENQDVPSEIPEEHIEIFLNALDGMFAEALGDSKQLVITLNRVQPEGKLVWRSVVKGTPVSIDTFLQFVAAVSRLA